MLEPSIIHSTVLLSLQNTFQSYSISTTDIDFIGNINLQAITGTIAYCRDTSEAGCFALEQKEVGQKSSAGCNRRKF